MSPELSKQEVDQIKRSLAEHPRKSELIGVMQGEMKIIAGYEKRAEEWGVTMPIGEFIPVDGQKITSFFEEDGFAVPRCTDPKEICKRIEQVGGFGGNGGNITFVGPDGRYWVGVGSDENVQALQEAHYIRGFGVGNIMNADCRFVNPILQQKWEGFIAEENRRKAEKGLIPQIFDWEPDRLEDNQEGQIPLISLIPDTRAADHITGEGLASDRKLPEWLEDKELIEEDNRVDLVITDQYKIKAKQKVEIFVFGVEEWVKRHGKVSLAKISDEGIGTYSEILLLETFNNSQIGQILDKWEKLFDRELLDRVLEVIKRRIEGGINETDFPKLTIFGQPREAPQRYAREVIEAWRAFFADQRQ